MTRASERIGAACRVVAGLWLAAGLVLPSARAGAQQQPDPLPRRGFFGAQVAPLADSVRTRVGVDSGVLVLRADPGTSAAEAGVRAGDVLVQVGTGRVAAPAQFVEMMRAYRPGARFAVQVVRGGKRLTLPVLLKEFPRESHPGFDVIYTSVPVEGARRRVIVTKPHGAGPFATVFLVGGIGCYSVDTPPAAVQGYSWILNHLTERGLVTVRVEKSGMGDSEGPPCSTTDFQTEVKGYVEALRAAKRYPYVDSSSVFILGHSIGGVAGPAVAAQLPVRGIMVLSTVGTSWLEYELDNTRRQLALGGTPYDSIDAQVKLKERCAHRLLVEKQTPGQIVADLPACREHMQYPMNYRYIQQLQDVELSQLWKRIPGPVLVEYPTSDFLTSEGQHRYLVDMIRSFRPGHPEQVTLELVPGMDHFFNKVGSQKESMQLVGSGRTGELNDAILGVLDRWLDGVLGRRVAG